MNFKNTLKKLFAKYMQISEQDITNETKISPLTVDKVSKELNNPQFFILKSKKFGEIIKEFCEE